MNWNSLMTWVKISIVLFSLILFLIGFLIGFIYSNLQESSCKQDAFAYGVKQVNGLKYNFVCSCTDFSNDSISFHFDESGPIRALR